MPLDAMIPALSQVCGLASTFEDDVADYSAGACKHIEAWFTKLETYLENHTVQDVRDMLREHDVTLPAAGVQGGLLVSQGDARREHWALFEKRLDLCRELNIGVMVIAGDIGAPFDSDSFNRLMVSLQQASQSAEKQSVRLAFEFQAEAAFANNLQTAASLVAQIGSPYLGICLDAFHFHKGPSKTEDLALLNCENLFHVQLSDVLDVPREFASDADRILPGEGQLDLTPLIQHLRDIGYSRAVSVELMNPRLSQVAPRQFGEIAITALRRLLGHASMG